MTISITSASQESFNLELKYPREFSGLHQLEERYSQKTAAWGNLTVNELWFDGACVFQSTIEANQHCRLKMQCDSPCWLMNFVLDGELNTMVQMDAALNTKANHFNCFYCSSLAVEAGIERKTHVFTVCLTRRFIKHLFWKSSVFTGDELANNGEKVFIAGNQLITTELKTIIGEITGAEQPTYIRRIYLEGKILELLSLQLKDSMFFTPDNTKSDVVHTDLSKLQTAKQLLEQNIRSPFTLTELAKQCGLNDFKLKKGFKEAFGFTVFGYLNELRMNRAKSMLQKGLPVNEVADYVGYKNAHHFTVAFKKRYQVLPRDVFE
ncbi:helix-turn-helix transcriptional regulator [Mucilaginibacter aquatilis]|nr:AraC family transcriptional regulator [Mucilaginibacter aquatilis]